METTAQTNHILTNHGADLLESGYVNGSHEKKELRNYHQAQHRFIDAGNDCQCQLCNQFMLSRNQKYSRVTMTRKMAIEFLIKVGIIISCVIIWYCYVISTWGKLYPFFRFSI